MKTFQAVDHFLSLFVFNMKKNHIEEEEKEEAAKSQLELY